MLRKRTLCTGKEPVNFTRWLRIPTETRKSCSKQLFTNIVLMGGWSSKPDDADLPQGYFLILFLIHNPARALLCVRIPLALWDRSYYPRTGCLRHRTSFTHLSTHFTATRCNQSITSPLTYYYLQNFASEYDSLFTKCELSPVWYIHNTLFYLNQTTRTKYCARFTASTRKRRNQFME